MKNYIEDDSLTYIIVPIGSSTILLINSFLNMYRNSIIVCYHFDHFILHPYDPTVVIRY